MHITNITNDYDNITDYDNMVSTNCTNNENNVEIVIPLITIIPCGMSLICLISLMAYTSFKKIIDGYIQIFEYLYYGISTHIRVLI